MTGTEIYKRTAAYERDARAIRLHAPHWKLLLAFDGERSLAEVALSAEISFAEALPLTNKFLQQGWIEEQPITLEQYLKRTGAADVSAIGAAVPPAVVLHQPKAVNASSPTPASPAEVKSAALPIAPPPLTAPKLPRGPMRLSAVVDYLTSLASNKALGQLLVYRVFLRVPPELLQAEEIASISLVNDNSLIRSEALQKAIANAVSDVAKCALPDGVFAPA